MKLIKQRRPAFDIFPSGFADRFFQDAFSPVVSSELERVFKPFTDVVKTETGYTLKVALPGVKKEDVKIELHDQTLSITGEHFHPYKEEKDQVLRAEISYGKFERHFTLGHEVDTQKIEAEFKDGLLFLHIPFSEKIAPKSISIK